MLDGFLARIRVHPGNARLAYEMHAALDASGRFLFATNHAGRVLWCTPKARELLSDAGDSRNTEVSLPPASVEEMLRLRRSDARASVVRFNVGHRSLECALLSPLGSDELRVSRGMANRDIGAIFNISPRTVNKHLEQVFIKLGVENRSAAAAVAVRTLTR